MKIRYNKLHNTRCRKSERVRSSQPTNHVSKSNVQPPNAGAGSPVSKTSGPASLNQRAVSSSSQYENSDPSSLKSIRSIQPKKLSHSKKFAALQS